LPDSDAILVIWFKLLTLAGKSNNSGLLFISDKIPYTDEMLSTIFNRKLETVRYALNLFIKFGMVNIENNTISISNWEKHQNIDGLEKIRETNRLRVAKHREKQQNLLKEDNDICNVTETLLSKSISSSDSNVLKDSLLTEQQKNFELIDFQAIRTLGRKLTFIEKEELEKYLIKFGEEMLVSQLRKAGMNNFKSIGTFLKNTNEKGFLILRDEADAERHWTFNEKQKFLSDNNFKEKDYFQTCKYEDGKPYWIKIK
jgi:predicted phage replisome organizer